MQTTIQTADGWWNTVPGEIRALFSGIGGDPIAQDKYDDFWQNLHPCDRNNIYRFYQAKTGVIEMPCDELYDLFEEIVCELADISLEKECNLSREEMCDEDGSFLEEYQDRFNELYDGIEERLLDYEW